MRRGTIAGAALAVAAVACLSSIAATAQEPVFRFAILSDRTGGHTEGIYPRVLEEIRLLSPDFVVTVGDHIEGYGDDFERVGAEWDTLLGFLDRLDVPIYMTPGNHDIWSDESEAVYTERTGQQPYYSFDHGNTHFVILDVIRTERSDQLPDEQRAWLVSDLRAAQEADNILVFYHKPLWVQTLTLGQPDPMHEVFLEHGVDAVFAAHLHRYFAADYDGIDYTVIGSSGGALFRSQTEPVVRGEFFQFGWVTVKPSGYELAVIDLGGIYPREVVTADGLGEIDRIETELIEVSGLPVREGVVEAARITVSVENAGDVPIEDLLAWEVPEGWTVSPARIDLVVAPGEAAEIEFDVKNTGPLYPVPRVSCGYPMSDGRRVEVDLPLEVTRTVEAAWVEEPPVIDGEVGEKEWADGTPTTEMFPPYDTIVEGETEFRFAYDAANLYLSAVCYDGEMDEVTATIEERDGAVYTEDCVGFFFQPDWDEMVVYQIYFNALGTPFDQRISFDETMYYTTDATWDGEYEVATQRTDDRWSIEARIPLEQIGADVTTEPVWGLNFRRKQARTSAACDWQIPIDYDPRTFGEMHFD